MNRFIFVFFFLVSVLNARVDNVTVDTDGNLIRPTAQKFHEKNVRTFKQDFRIFVDTSTSVRDALYDKQQSLWTDCELKVIGKDGSLIYFTSTNYLNNSEVKWLHPNVYDNTAKFFYWDCSYWNEKGGCWGERKAFTDFNSCIGAKSSNGAVSAIWIYPNLNGTINGKSIRSIFEDPENTILVWRLTLDSGEYYAGNKLWRPARLEYFGEFKEVK